MRYYLDCEFNGMGGSLMSLALVSEPCYGGSDQRYGKELYLADAELRYFLQIAKEGGSKRTAFDPWVWDNVVPIINADQAIPEWIEPSKFAANIERFLRDDKEVVIVTDWPDDIKYFCELILTGPGTMIEIRPGLKFDMQRVDAYPTTLPGAIQHNALWDARALRHKLQGAA